MALIKPQDRPVERARADEAMYSFAAWALVKILRDAGWMVVNDHVGITRSSDAEGDMTSFTWQVTLAGAEKALSCSWSVRDGADFDEVFGCILQAMKLNFRKLEA